MSGDSIPRCFLLVLLIVLGGLFAAAETALSYCNRIRMRTLADEGDKRARRVADITDKFDSALVTLLIGTNVIHVAASSIATVTAMDIFAGLPFFEKYASVIATVVLTLAVFIFSETIPKNIARANSDAAALAFSVPIAFLMKLCTPFAFVFSKMGDALKKMLDSGHREPSMTEDEFSEIIESISEDGIFEKEESDIIKSAVEFSDLTAADVMTARDKTDGIEQDESIEQLREIILNIKHTRVPVYKGTLDCIVGIVQTGDCLWQLMQSGSVNLRSISKRPYIIAPDMSVQTLFEEMEKRRTHIAVVAQNGRTLGIVTMEDILEELVGEIYDEDEKKDRIDASADSSAADASVMAESEAARV